MANDIAHNGNSTIELILMDCDMPVMDGFTCANHIVNFKI
jgi:CheY-like chemotaxis protein